MNTFWFVLVGAGAIGLGVLVYKRRMSKLPGAVNASYSGGPPPPPPPRAGDPTRPDGGGPASWVNAAVQANNAGITAACAKSGQDPRVCKGLVAVNDFVVQDTIVKPAEYAWDTVSGWLS